MGLWLLDASMRASSQQLPSCPAVAGCHGASLAIACRAAGLLAAEPVGIALAAAIHKLLALLGGGIIIPGRHVGQAGARGRRQCTDLACVLTSLLGFEPIPVAAAATKHKTLALSTGGIKVPSRQEGPALASLFWQHAAGHFGRGIGQARGQAVCLLFKVVRIALAPAIEEQHAGFLFGVVVPALYGALAWAGFFRELAEGGSGGLNFLATAGIGSSDGAAGEEEG